MVEEGFSNQQVDVNSIPRTEHINLQPLDPKYLKVELALNTIFWLIIISVFLILWVVDPWDLPGFAQGIAGGVLVVLVVLSYVLTFLGFKKKKYALREKDILYQSGLIWRTFSALPFNRIQHAEIHQGPIERMFDLSNLKIYTAGGSSSDLSIKGLTLGTAQSMKDYILDKSTSDEEE